MTEDKATAEKQPIFQEVFGESWANLPPVMKDHYAVRAGTNDLVRVEGNLDIRISWPVSIMARLTGMLLAYSGDKVPVTVVFTSPPGRAGFQFDRTFHFPNRGDVQFRSRMEYIGGNELIEFMGFGIGWKMAYFWNGSKVVLEHRGYVWRFFGVQVPLPLALIMGQGRAEETPISDREFSMWTHSNHGLFGKMFAYEGSFKVTEVSCNQS